MGPNRSHDQRRDQCATASSLYPSRLRTTQLSRAFERSDSLIPAEWTGVLELDDDFLVSFFTT